MCHNRSVQRLCSFALVLVLAVLAAGCGSKSSQPMSAADWADGVCSAVTTWKSSITSTADSLKSGNLTQDSLKSASDDVSSATDTLESDLKDLGKPDTQSGQQAQASIDQLSSDLTTDRDSIKTAADGVTDLSGVPAAVTTIRTTLQTMQSQVTSTVSSLEQLDAPQGELQTAFQQSSACQQLSSSTS
jgi:chromosome segregation ATPase